MKRKLILGSSITAAAVLLSITFSSTVSAQGSAKWKKDKNGTIIVTSGTFDGGGKSFGKIGSGSQDESQPAVFELEPGTNLKNVKIVPPSGDGIHVQGNNRVSNVHFSDVGEDAISMRSSSKGGVVIIENSSFKKGADKIFQANKESIWYIKNCEVDGAGKVMRQNGGKTFKLTVFIDGLNAKNYGEAIVRSDASACTVYYKDCPSKWKGKLKAVKWDGKNPKPPTLPGGGSTETIYSIAPGSRSNISNVNFAINSDQVQVFDLVGRTSSTKSATPAGLHIMKLEGTNYSKGVIDLQK